MAIFGGGVNVFVVFWGQWFLKWIWYSVRQDIWYARSFFWYSERQTALVTITTNHFCPFFFWHVTCQRLLIRSRSFLILGTEKVTLQQNPFFLLLFFFSWQRNTFFARTEFIFTGSKTFNKPGWNLELPGFVTEKIILDLMIEKKIERSYEHQMWIILLRLQRILNFFLSFSFRCVGFFFSWGII